MRIVIDFHAAGREGTGNCTYIRNLVENLINIDKENEYFLYVTNIKYKYYEKFKNIKNVYFRLIKTNNPFIRIPLLGLKTYQDRIDVLHVQYIAPPIHKGRLIVTIHDVSFLHFPQCFGRFERLRQRILIPLNIKKADKILTDSNYSQEDITKNYNVGKKIEVIYNGVAPNFRPLENLENKKELINKYCISEKFILFVGRIDARKNVPSLIKSFLKLKEEKKIHHQLVIVGKEDFLPEQVKKEMKTMKYRKDIIFPGRLPEDYLPIFYNLADVFVYPTLYEGFGLPVLEAMACGCPVISSKVSSIPEIVGDSGLLVDPLNVEELSCAIYRVIYNSDLKKELKDKGLKQAKKFNWYKTAIQTLNVYKKILL